MDADFSTELPPVVACPAWCTETHHGWEPDGSCWLRWHRATLSDLALPPVKVSAVDSWWEGTFDRSETLVELEDAGSALPLVRLLLGILPSEERRRLLDDADAA